MHIEEKTVTSTVRWIEFDGVKYYPDKKGYWIGGTGKSIKRLHVAVWEKYNGPVPKGFQIHHIDHDPNNNEIENLQLMSRSDHLSYHGQLMNKDLARENLLNKAQPAAIEWHKSAEGREWHRTHYEESLADKWEQTVEKRCPVCGKMFEAHALIEKRSRFCSENCKAQYRRDVGIDNIERPCDVCGKPVWTNKYAPKHYCSKECRAIGSRKQRELNMQNRLTKN